MSKVDNIVQHAAKRARNANKAALRNVGVRVLGGENIEKRYEGPGNSKPAASHVRGEDPLYDLSAEGRVIEPPFDMLVLSCLPEHSSELNQSVEAMETNIDRTGHRFVARVKLEQAAEDDPIREEVKKERIRLENFFTYATRESFREFRRRLRRDYETTGNAYFEVLRNAAGKITGFTHVPSYQVRLGILEEVPRLVDRHILALQDDGSVVVETIKEWRRFRTFVQSRHVSSRGQGVRTIGHKVNWFKEFGDPEIYHRETGEPAKAGEVIPEDKRANEIVHIRNYCVRSPYGVPRFIGNLLSIYGDRAAEEINWTTFKNNCVPSMAIFVSNGQLTQGSLDRLSDFAESNIQGSENRSKFVVIEAEPTAEEGEEGGQVKIDIKPLTESQHNDALFQNYGSNNQDKIRRAFRLPPIFVGRSDDYTRATAESSRRLADEQIFSPERDEFDDVVNRVLFPVMGVVYHRYKSNTPNTTDNTQLVKILAGAEKTGGMTPRIARTMLEDILSVTLPDFPDDFDPDVPFSLTMAEAVKNEADASEPGQTVTALKNLGDELGLDDEESVEKLLEMNERVEKLWRGRALDKP